MPNQYRPAMRAGMRLVRVVWPRARQIDIWRAGDEEPSTVLGEGDRLDGEGVAAGFSLAVA